MKKILFASAALILCLSGAASASALVNIEAPKFVAHSNGVQLAKNGSDDGADHDSGDDHGGGDSSGSDHSGSDNSGHGSANSGHGNSDDADEADEADDAADDNVAETPDVSGCDSASDIAEHPECSAAQ